VISSYRAQHILVVQCRCLSVLVNVRTIPYMDGKASAIVSQVPSKAMYHMLDAAHRGFDEPKT